jgi:hypothetical protein
VRVASRGIFGASMNDAGLRLSESATTVDSLGGRCMVLSVRCPYGRCRSKTRVLVAEGWIPRLLAQDAEVGIADLIAQLLNLAAIDVTARVPVLWRLPI